MFYLRQVFEVKRGKFGPMWECGELMSIGLWVGLLVSLGFALICAWGFTMLASIEVNECLLLISSLKNSNSAKESKSTNLLTFIEFLLQKKT